METKSVQDILREIRPKFLEDFRVDVTLLAHLESNKNNNKCLEQSQSEELIAIKIPRDRVFTLFDFLGRCPNSIDALIDFFEKIQTTQPHLLKLLKETRDMVLNASHQPGPSFSTGPSNGTDTDPRLFFKLNDKHGNALVKIILQNKIALESWGSLLHSLIAQADQQLRVQGFLKDSKYDEAVRTTLQYYIEENGPTMNDLMEVFKEHRLTKLNEKLLEELKSLRML